jgi:guanosine-3',5'-bis(diphosphate) 3'-pyrophosphohydrolase
MTRSADPRTTARVLAALRFAAAKHRDQRRKDPEASPYINHPIEVADVLVRVGEIDDLDVILAAVLHDTIEDTETTGDELAAGFGERVRGLVEEVSDDKRLPKQERKDRQIHHAAALSTGAKQVKLADKICNVRDVTHAPPADWPLERRATYLDWSERVVAGCRGVSAPLEREFDRVLGEGRARLAREG